MQINITNVTNGIVLHMLPDEMDAKVSIDRIWFKFDREVSFNPLRLGLIGYTLSRDLIGNTFEFNNLRIPAHLAAAISSDFGGHEFFSGGISNVADRITVPSRYKLVIDEFGEIFSVVTSINSDNLTLKRTHRGYHFTNSEEQVVLECSTNLDLFCSLYSSNPPLICILIIFLLSYDALCVTGLVVNSNILEMSIYETLLDTVREVGGHVEFI